MKSWPREDERALLADTCHRSFRAFAKYGFGLQTDPDSAKKWYEPVHGPLCDWLQTRIEVWEETRRKSELRRHYLLIDAMRGSLKTAIVTKALTMWLHLRHPNLMEVLDSVQQTNTIEFAEVIKLKWENQDPTCWFSWLYGIWEGRETWTKDRFTHAARAIVRTEASIECSSVETGVTGRHHDVHILDDPITEEKLRESGNWIRLAKKHVAAIRPALLNDGLLIVVATPYRDDDVVTTEITQHGVCEVHGEPLPPEYRDAQRSNGRWYMYHLPARDQEGNPTLPTVWPEDELASYERDNPSEAAAQVHLRPGAAGDQPLTWELLEEYIISDSEIPAGIPVSIHLDTAFKDKKSRDSGDENVIAVWGHIKRTGRVIFLEARHSNRWTIDEFVNKFLSVLMRYKRRHQILAVTDERQIGGHSKGSLWKQRLRQACHDAGIRLPRFIEISRAGKKKSGRIMDAAGYWADGYVLLRRQAPGLNALMWQMVRIDVSPHDDIADACSDVFHPEIYSIGKRRDGSQPTRPARPFDEFLKTGKLTNAAALEAYDAVAAMNPEDVLWE